MNKIIRDLVETAIDRKKSELANYQDALARAERDAERCRITLIRLETELALLKESLST
jgi:predicted  nucleic acid-binding Zn-ribbon protein